MQEQFQVVLTDEIFDITPVVIYKGKEYSSCLSTIAVTETSLYSELMVSLLFPDAEIKQYGTQEECLEAVANGKVGATVIPSSKINLLNESPLTQKPVICRNGKTAGISDVYDERKQKSSYHYQ